MFRYQNREWSKFTFLVDKTKKINGNLSECFVEIILHVLSDLVCSMVRETGLTVFFFFFFFLTAT